MSGLRLATYVHVADEHDQMHVFGPDSAVPAWAAKKITNPDAWVGGKVPSAIEEPQEEAARLRARLAELEAQTVGGGEEPPRDGPPPKGGPGSGAPAWREYAASKQVEVPADASREIVVAALEAAGVRTE
ncbi:hypothetical protein O7602_26735 [Micromonospora sp. WMMD1128]|uniref:hypothetical protein n=1 Tax=Micromonospora sp. WMMD1128 TaxID=3015150 RepID=UPI00248B8E37|nr:hypothetical protein [Micromonospora sp. WMMD1128]WBB73241.1 hypothetical protein O7602_26735 [Micromonospora sp. WMMD1128]